MNMHLEVGKPDQTPDPSHQKGEASERKALTALLVMIKHGPNIKELRAPPVVDVIPVEKNSTMDRHGTDLVAILADGHKIPISIRSSVRSKHKYQRRHKMRQQRGWFVMLTEAILVRSTDRICSVITVLADYLNRFYVVLKRETNKIRHFHMCQKIRRHGRVPERGTFVRNVPFALR